MQCFDELAILMIIMAYLAVEKPMLLRSIFKMIQPFLNYLESFLHVSQISVYSRRIIEVAKQWLSQFVPRA